MKAEFRMDCPSYPIGLSSTTGTYGLSIEDAKALTVELDRAIAQAEAVRDFAQRLLAMADEYLFDEIWEKLRKEYDDS